MRHVNVQEVLHAQLGHEGAAHELVAQRPQVLLGVVDACLQREVQPRPPAVAEDGILAHPQAGALALLALVLAGRLAGAAGALAGALGGARVLGELARARGLHLGHGRLPLRVPGPQLHHHPAAFQ